MRRIVLVAAGVAVLTAITAALHYSDASPTAVFLLAGVALGGIAWVVGVSTESVGARFGPAVTGALQSTLGNLPELFIVLFALSAGEVVVAQTSILGSLFANALLVLGLAIVAGARAADGEVMRFHKRLPNDTATLLILALSAIVVLGLSDRLGDRASEHEVAISVVGAVCLLVVYGAWLQSYLRSDRRRARTRGRAARARYRSPPRSSSSRRRARRRRSSRTGSSTRSIPPCRPSGSRRRSPGS